MNNKLNAKILLIIVILVVPLSCLALAIASVFVGFGLTAATSASGPVDPEAVEAEIINIAPSSVHTYSRRIRTKLDLPDLPSLVKFAIEHGLID